VTQCLRCMGFGHGSRHCGMRQRCLNCAQNHNVADCTVVPPTVPKCANCDGNHKANDPECPQRAHFQTIRQQATQRRPKTSAHGRNMVPPPPLSSYPPIGRNGSNAASAALAAPAAGVRAPVRDKTPAIVPRIPPGFQYSTALRMAGTDQTASQPNVSSEETALYDAATLMQIFSTMVERLNSCRSRREQVAVIGELIIRYGC